MPGPASPAPDEPGTGPQQLTIAVLYGPVVQFAQPAASSATSIVAMPPQLPMSVDCVFKFPPSATLPDNVAHFCFAPVLKLHEPSELPFCLTDSSGNELYGASLQILLAHGSSNAKHRPVALVMLSGRPLYAGMSKLLHLLLPLVQQVRASRLLCRRRCTAAATPLSLLRRSRSRTPLPLHPPPPPRSTSSSCAAARFSSRRPPQPSPLLPPRPHHSPSAGRLSLSLSLCLSLLRAASTEAAPGEADK
jgi:hypothetical protein